MSLGRPSLEKLIEIKKNAFNMHRYDEVNSLLILENLVIVTYFLE